MGKIVLSFCVVSYNRAELTLSLVNNILKNKRNDIDVVVVDNCSTDNTVELLSQIEDERLKVVVNEQNYGAVGNFVESLRFGDGIYSFVALSRDNIIPEKVSHLVDYLKENDFSALYCGELKEDRENQIYTKGKSAAIEFSYKSLHPTGHVFKTELIQKYLKEADSTKAYEQYGNFPHDFWMLQSALDGDICAYNKVVRTRVPDSYYNTHPSTVQFNNPQMWFFPSGIIYQHMRNLEHLYSLGIDEKLLDKLECLCYKRAVFNLTIRYRDWRANELICSHYGVSPQNVKLKEMIDGITDLNRTISKETHRSSCSIKMHFLKRKAKTELILKYLYIRLCSIH